MVSPDALTEGVEVERDAPGGGSVVGGELDEDLWPLGYEGKRVVRAAPVELPWGVRVSSCNENALSRAVTSTRE